MSLIKEHFFDDEVTVLTDRIADCYSLSNGCIEISYSTSQNGICLTNLRTKSRKGYQWVSKQPVALFESLELDYKDCCQTVAVTYKEINHNGRAALQHTVSVQSGQMRISSHTVVYPHLPVIKLWCEYENFSHQDIPVNELKTFQLGLNDCDKHYHITGDNNTSFSLMIKENQMNTAYDHTIRSDKHIQYLPWSCFEKASATHDSLAVWLDYAGSWQMRTASSQDGFSFASYIEFKDAIRPQERWSAPSVILCVFDGDFDHMMEQMYQWQYLYQWDWVNNDYFARPAYTAPWYFYVSNLCENFASRIAGLDITTVDYADAVGAQLLWHDAGWSEGIDIWKPTQEGPDFSHTIRYLRKKGMGFIIWFAGHPQSWLLQNKVNSWGNFQWRTDGQGEITERLQKDMHDRMETFLQDNPGCSFHTCDCGGKYSHCFSVQRLADTNYLADMGNGEHTNYYTSYWEIPDKWLDMSTSWLGKGYCNPMNMRTALTMCPSWAFFASCETLKQVEKMIRIYRYLLAQGVAGRWSFAYHPTVEGDDPAYYCQRTSYDKKKACIILKRVAKSFSYKVFPKGLIPDYTYSVSLDSRTHGARCYTNWVDNEPMPEIRTGKDLMENGILLSIQSLFPGDLIYLGMENRPGSGNDKTPPAAPGQVFTRREVNCGHLGIGVYWSPGHDDNFLDGYEIMRDGVPLTTVRTGKYYFDRTLPCDSRAEYFVRSLDGDGNVSGWTPNKRLDDQPECYSSLGGHGEGMGRGGWVAEYSINGGKTFQPMKWVTPAYSTAGDLGGRGDQPGGVEGLWYATDGAVIGRGWQAPSKTEQAIRCFIAPKGGKAVINGRVMREKYHAGKGGILTPAIYHNKKLVWGNDHGTALLPDDLNGHAHSMVLNLQKGDCLRFVIDCGIGADDIVGWVPTVTYLCENTTVYGSTVRILCGSHQDAEDQQGNLWQADTCYHGGCAERYDYNGQSIPFFRFDSQTGMTCRRGESFQYAVPVSHGIYSVRLIFAEPLFQYSYERPFHIDIGGERVETNFDINQLSHCRNRVVDKIYHYVVPQEDGKIHLSFSGGFDPMQKSAEAIISAIEIVPQTEITFRANAGDQDFTDWCGNVWAALKLPYGAELLTSELAVAQATPTLYDQKLYQTAFQSERLFFDFDLPQGFYTVHIKFCEMWQQQKERRLAIIINGEKIKQDYPVILPENGKGRACDFSYSGVVPDCYGKIYVYIESVCDLPAIVQGIEIY